MPILPPALDDRSFDDLVEELLARAAAHTPEWSPRLGDPGRTMVDLFAWLADTILYRANLIPERQRLTFLRLLGIPLRSAIPAQGMVSVLIDDADVTQPLTLQPLATVKGAVNFETKTELTVLPITAAAFYKRRLTEAEQSQLAEVVQGLQQIYSLNQAATPYITTPVFAGGLPQTEGFDLVQQAVDRSLWLAILAPKPELVEAVRRSLGQGEDGRQQVISIGVMPKIDVPALFEEIGSRARIPHVWEISTGQDVNGEPDYLTLEAIADSTGDLRRRGVVRLLLPAPRFIGAPSNDVRTLLNAGVGDRPPRLDSPDLAARLVTWLRLRPTTPLASLALSWVDVNAIEIDQRQTSRGKVIGQSSGSADQVFQLPGQSVEAATLEIQVEEPDAGYQVWRRVEDLALADRDDAVYRLDSEAGMIQFGNGVRGRIPALAMRIRVAQMRSGGGRLGNLPAGSLKEIVAFDLQGRTVTTRLKLVQALPTAGGEDAETLEAAEQRIPAVLRHRDRAVTESDYRQIAAETPGVQLGRVEILPRFKPQQRRSNIPGVVSVMVLPAKLAIAPPNPRPDRPLLEAVHAYLDSRRPLGTELYVIGCEYVPLGLSIGVQVRDGFGRDQTLTAVREALHQFLWSLAPGDVSNTGWQLGKSVQERELEVVVARVPGVQGVLGVNLFQQQGDRWRRVKPTSTRNMAEVRLESWQLPELLSVVVVTDAEPPTELVLTQRDTGESGVAVPVVPEVC